MSYSVTKIYGLEQQELMISYIMHLFLNLIGPCCYYMHGSSYSTVYGL